MACESALEDIHFYRKDKILIDQNRFTHTKKKNIKREINPTSRITNVIFILDGQVLLIQPSNLLMEKSSTQKKMNNLGINDLCQC